MSWLSQTANAEPALDVASPVSRAVHGIWEADELFKCPLVGMGITLAEQKHLLQLLHTFSQTNIHLEENVASGG